VSGGVLRRLAAEFVGTALLLAVVVGSGIMGERLANGNTAIALFANSLATGGGLFVLILSFAPVSGAHFNPLVTAGAVVDRTLPMRVAAGYLAAQLGGALCGVALAHAMFEAPLWAASATVRTGASQWIAEAVATFGLVLTIRGTARYGTPVLAAAVGTYIAAAYWFTASTSFANPAVTIARALTPTFAGIRPVDVAGFLVAQCVGAVLAFAYVRLHGDVFSKRLDGS
jgi:glycerol uptake facilitator-like aquaporin